MIRESDNPTPKSFGPRWESGRVGDQNRARSGSARQSPALPGKDAPRAEPGTEARDPGASQPERSIALGTDRRLAPPLEHLPLLVLELTGDGVITAANRRFEALFGGDPTGLLLSDIAAAVPAPRMRRLLASIETFMEPAGLIELRVRTQNDEAIYPFQVVADEESGRVWLVERPPEPKLADLHQRLASVNDDLRLAQRDLAKKSGRLSHALDEIERKLSENESLSHQLQSRNQAVGAQQQELLGMTETLHRGQEELLQLNQQLERRTRELQVALSGRSRFYASMSHELRTPVNAVLGYNDLLLAGIYGEMNEQQEIAIERSQRAVRHLRELINDVLDISRLEAGKLDVEVEEVGLEELLHDLLATVQPMSDAQGSEVHIALDSGAERLRTDPRRLRQILLNLLSNAIKYGGGKPIWVRGERAAQGAVVVEVVDNGPGIDAADIGSIFDEFTQLSLGESGGTGLGLAIARRLARLLGGSLEASSTMGVGTTFRLKLPESGPTVEGLSESLS